MKGRKGRKGGKGPPSQGFRFFFRGDRFPPSFFFFFFPSLLLRKLLSLLPLKLPVLHLMYSLPRSTPAALRGRSGVRRSARARVGNGRGRMSSRVLLGLSFRFRGVVLLPGFPSATDPPGPSTPATKGRERVWDGEGPQLLVSLSSLLSLLLFGGLLLFLLLLLFFRGWGVLFFASFPRRVHRGYNLRTQPGTAGRWRRGEGTSGGSRRHLRGHPWPRAPTRPGLGKGHGASVVAPQPVESPLAVTVAPEESGEVPPFRVGPPPPPDPQTNV